MNNLLNPEQVALVENVELFKKRPKGPDDDLYLKYACFHCSKPGMDRIVRILLTRGAKANTDNNFCIKQVCLRGCENAAYILGLLCKHLTPEDINVDNGKPLLFAAMLQRCDLIRVLLVNGADPTINNYKAIKICVELNSEDCLKQFIEHSNMGIKQYRDIESGSSGPYRKIIIEHLYKIGIDLNKEFSGYKELKEKILLVPQEIRDALFLHDHVDTRVANLHGLFNDPDHFKIVLEEYCEKSLQDYENVVSSGKTVSMDDYGHMNIEIYELALLDNRKQILQILLDNYKSKSYTDRLLIEAVLQQKKSFIQLLLENGANINAENGKPLLAAVYVENCDMISFLIRNGARNQTAYVNARYKKLPCAETLK